MTDAETHVFSRETKRARPVPGGTTKCSRCDQARMPSLTYCKAHHAEYQREWRKRRNDEFHRLRAIAALGENHV